MVLLKAKLMPQKGPTKDSRALTLSKLDEALAGSPELVRVSDDPLANELVVFGV